MHLDVIYIAGCDFAINDGRVTAVFHKTKYNSELLKNSINLFKHLDW